MKALCNEQQEGPAVDDQSPEPIGAPAPRIEIEALTARTRLLCWLGFLIVPLQFATLYWAYKANAAARRDVAGGYITAAIINLLLFLAALVYMLVLGRHPYIPPHSIEPQF